MAEAKAACSASALKTLSDEILARLEAHPAFVQAQTVLLYHSLKDEVQTHAFIEKWCRKKRIVLPVVAGDVLELRLYTGPDSLKIGSYGIAEPAGEAFTDYTALDLAVIPGVAFDSEKHRLGRGKGYYDKLLPLLPSTLKAGICFPFQLLEEVPAEPFDVCMDFVITL